MSQSLQQETRGPWWNRPFDDAWTLPGMLGQSMLERRGSRAVLGENGKWISFNELSTSGQFWSRQIVATSREGPLSIACLTSSTQAFYTTIIAGVMSGSRVVMLDYKVPVDRNRMAVTDAEVEVLFVDKQTESIARDVLRNSVAVVRIDESSDLEDRLQGLPQNRAAVGGGNQFVIFTSGSTGRPKGVVRSFQSILHAIYNYSSRFESRSEDVMLYIGSPGHVGTLNDVLCGLLSGYAVVPVRPDTLDIGRTIEMIGTLGVNKIAVPPSLLRLMCRRMSDCADSHDLEMITPSGEPLLRSDLRLVFDRFGPGLKIWQSYGSTEVGHICSGLYKPFDAQGSGPLPLRRLGEGIGIELVNEDGNPSSSARGVIRVRSRYLADGYLRPESDEERRFGSDARGRFFDTGDQARLLEDGSFVLEGRSDRQIGIRGQRLELGDVESAVLTTPGWVEASATAIRTGSGDFQIAVLVSRDPNLAADPDELREALRAKLPAFAVPRFIFAVDALPRTPTAKVDLARVDQIVKDRLIAGDQGPAQSSELLQGPSENWIADAWQYVTRSAIRPGPGMRFDDYGGDSLAALALCLQIAEQTGLALGMDFVTEFMTIREQAEEIERRRSGIPSQESKARLVPLGPNRDGPTVIMIPGIGGHAWVYRSVAREMVIPCDLQCVQLSVRGAAASSEVGSRAVAKLVVEHLAGIKQSRPLLLGGFSYGAIIAIEVAKQLQSAGVVPDDLLLIDPAASSPGASIRREWRECLRKIKRFSRRGDLQVRSVLDHEVWLTSKAIRREYPLRRGMLRHQRFHALLSNESWTVASFDRLISGRRPDSRISVAHDLKHLDLMRERGARRVALWMDQCIGHVLEQRIGC
jgi:acyl-coenzyme A synthetase/AMP-(fatty) acid ligase/acyl carrier protein